MAPPEHRNYTVRTPGLVAAPGSQALGHHSRSHSQPFASAKPATSAMSSPRVPPSAGHQRPPPKLSPAASRSGAADLARPPSPNYFGLAVDSADPRDPSLLPREHWASSSPSLKPFAAGIPKQLPLDANPEFEAFRRQVDANLARVAFNLSASHFNITTPPAVQRPRPPQSPAKGDHMSGAKADREADSPQEDSAYVSADFKRSSAVSLNPLPLLANLNKLEIPSLHSQPPFPPIEPRPGGINGVVPTTDGRPSPTSFAARGKTYSPPLTGSSLASTGTSGAAGAAAAPQSPGAGGGPAMISPPELKDLLEGPRGADVLLLDLRVSPQFAQSRVRGALNLCIPTTLLKRATFNLQKLQQTFQADGDQDKFSRWREASHLVVYDASSSDRRDATSALNMIKKFTNEGYSGPTSILRGGFNAFAAAYPSLIDRSSGGTSPGSSLGANSASGGARPSVPPVIGGVLLPKADENPSPFFNNIRQNQDLVDGVGQMEIGVPSGLAEDSLPRWLRDAAEASDRGKRVSDKFLRIELTEQSRMREAYSISMSADMGRRGQEAAAKVQLSGIEQGGKNRYKDILPFEHARVKLLGRPEGASDYVNASHIQANRSYKRYIASQGPLPATFEDFWSVIWDHDVRVIVMLTAESEGGQLKCHPYWKGNDFGPIKLRVLSEKKVPLDIDRCWPAPSTGTTNLPTDERSEDSHSSAQNSFFPEVARRRANTTAARGPGAQASCQAGLSAQAAGIGETPCVVIRKFALSHAQYPFSPIREITQLHYPSWPDFGAPAQPSHLLALVELANIMQRATPPIDAQAAVASASQSPQGGVANAANEATPSSGRRGADRGSHAGSARPESESPSWSWYDGPEPNRHARPMLVHCSAGCGRTGAFCTVDSVIDMLKRQRQHAAKASNKASDGRGQQSNSSGSSGGKPGGPGGPAQGRDSDGDVTMVDEGLDGTDAAPAANQADCTGSNGAAEAAGGSDQHPGIDTSWLDDDSVDLIAQTVEDFRGQRLSMVQSLRQFVLCYETVLEWIRRSQQGGQDPRGKGHGRSGSLAF